jgi:SAM-dependent methyltransferase
MLDIVSKHYDIHYFDWQANHGKFGGLINQSKFIEYISNSDTVLDFGCGGGYLLKGLKCRNKIGIEVNPPAIKCAQKNGVVVFKNAEEVMDECVDVIISNHALEHSTHPLGVLKLLYKKLKIGGKIIFTVPCESIFCRYKPNDINNHLYSWSPMCIGNLFKEAGFVVIESKPLYHKWPPKYDYIARVGGMKFINMLCRLFGRVSLSISQVRVVAEKRRK